MPPQVKNLTGTTYGRLTYGVRVGTNKHKKPLWEATCTCGNRVVVAHRQAESCGCLLRERIVEVNRGPKSEEHCRRISEAKTAKTTWHVCPHCGDKFFGTKTQRFCCLQHGRLFRDDYYGRRALHYTRQTGAKYVAVDFWQVYERDGGMCQACKEPCPKEFRGDAKAKRAPQLGHIIPLSRGGDHTYDNVQLECATCNNRKSNSLPEGMVEPRTNPDPRTRIEKIREETKKAMQRPEIQNKLHAPRPKTRHPRAPHTQESKHRMAAIAKAVWARRKVALAIAQTIPSMP